MVQMNETALRALINRLIIQNTTGEISGTDANTVLIDMIDSLTFRSTSTTPPEVRSFSIQDQPTEVDAGVTLSGTKTFLYSVTEPGNVNGDLTLLQAAATLSSTIDPTGSSAAVAINNVTLNAGDTVVFTLRGTDTIGPTQFERTFTVRGRTDDDYVYISDEADSDPSDVIIANASRTPFVAGQQTLTIPTFSGNRFLTILQKASETELSQIVIDSVNQIDAFIKTDNALVINSENFDAWVSENQLVGSIVSGEQVLIVR